MKKTSQSSSMKRKRSDDSPELIVSKSAKTSVPNIRTQASVASVVTSHGNIAYNTNRMLNEHLLKRNSIKNIQAKNDAQNVVIQESSRKLRAELKNVESETMNLQEPMDLLYMIKEDADKKMQYLNGLETEVANYTLMAAVVKQKYMDIEELRNQIKSAYLKNKASIEREVELHNRKLVKVNDDIDFVLRQREKAASQNAVTIEEKAKLIVKLSQLQTELEKIRDRIILAKREKETNVVTLDELKNRIEQLKNCAIENAEGCSKIKEEKTRLMAVQENSNITLATVIEKNKMLNNELIQLKAKTTDLKNSCDRIHQANKNICNTEEHEHSKLKYEEEYSSLLNEEKTMAAKVAELKISIDKRNSQYNELKRVQSQISEKQQHFAEVESKLTALKTDIYNRLSNIFVILNSIDEMKAQRNKNAKKALTLAAMVDSDDNNVSHISTTVDVDELSLENDVESEMTEDSSRDN